MGEGRATHSRFSMPLAKLGEKKYYLGIFFKVRVSPSDLLDNPDCLFAGQLVQGWAVLPVPRDAPGQHQQRAGAEGAPGAHSELRWVFVIYFSDCFVRKINFLNWCWWFHNSDQNISLSHQFLISIFSYNRSCHWVGMHNNSLDNDFHVASWALSLSSLSTSTAFVISVPAYLITIQFYFLKRMPSSLVSFLLKICGPRPPPAQLLPTPYSPWRQKHWIPTILSDPFQCDAAVISSRNLWALDTATGREKAWPIFVVLLINYRTGVSYDEV